MWYIGIAVTSTSSPSFNATGMNALNCSVLATRLRCDRAAPFDSPVVPPVYCRNSRSSPVSATGRSGSPPPWASASAKETDSPSRASTGGLGSVAPLASPTPTVMTVFRPVLARTSASVGVEPLKTTIVSTPASLSWCSSSRGVYNGFTFTCTAPARMMPSSVTGNASRFGIITATRSPWRTPSLFCR